MSLADANFVLALLLPERGVQHTRAVAALDRAKADREIIALGELIAGEVCWVLESSYGWKRARVAEVLLALLAGPELRPWDEPECSRALRLMKENPSLALADCLLLVRAAVRGERVLTFDRRLQRMLP